jgi:hypothetical protein
VRFVMDELALAQDFVEGNFISLSVWFYYCLSHSFVTNAAWSLQLKASLNNTETK